MYIPILSAVTLFAELLITASVYFIIWKAYRTGTFFRWFAFGVLAYEVLFNISYMFSKELRGDNAGVLNPYETTLAIFHGTFSLLMFILLLIFFIAAARGYRRGDNYFLKHRQLTIAFVYAWGLSILSGAGLFASLYLH
jgi:hypothetical protein